MPKLSIIVPVFNAEIFIERCVNSILSQTFIDFELILINDGSLDKSGEICESFSLKDDRVKVIHQKNYGQSAARNAGLKISQGNYIGFVDSDDWISPDMYEYLITIIENNSCDVAEINYYITHKYIDVPHVKTRTKILKRVEVLVDYLERGMNKRVSGYPVVNKIYRSELFNKIKFEPISLGEDYLINFQLLSKASKVIQSNKIGYFYFQREDSTIHGNLKKNDFNLLVNCSKVLDIAMEINNKKMIKLADSKLSRCYFSLLSKAMFYGVDEDVSVEDTKVLQKSLRKNYYKLLCSPMPLNRKIIMTVLVINSFLNIIRPKYR